MGLTFFRRQFSPIAFLHDEDRPFMNSDKPVDADFVLSSNHSSTSLTFVQKLTIISALLSPVLLLISAFNIYHNWSFNRIHDEDVFTRAIFGDLPFTGSPFGSHEDEFMSSDPYDGQASALYRGKPFNESHEKTAWDDIYPSDHLAVQTPERYGLWGGIDLAKEGKHKDEWSGQMGFTMGILHQLHCVGILKHTVMMYNNTEESNRLTEFEIYHANHCVGVLRELVLCKGDLTVQKPKGLRIPEGKEWPSKHKCRDEKALLDTIWKRAIVKTDGGWVRRHR